MSKHILITGATGLIGSRLTELLLRKGYQVSHMGRSGRNSGAIKSFVWNIEKESFDREALHGVDAVIHLAGAGVADKRWTEKRKKEILESRTKSTALLYKMLQSTEHKVKSVVSASAIGYYGYCLDERVFTEESKPGEDFLAQVTRQWESEVDKFDALSIRTVKIRIGIVLSEQGGALKKIARYINYGVGASLGTGKQYMSWIHIDDLCRMFIAAIDDSSMNGAYNGVCDWISNKELTKATARVLKRPLLLPSVPRFAIKILIGEMAMIVVNGSKVSSEKIRQTGFKFQFPELDGALRNLLKH